MVTTWNGLKRSPMKPSVTGLKKTVRSRNSTLNLVSDAQRLVTKIWRSVTFSKWTEVGEVCQWCGFRANIFVDSHGHHVDGRSGKDHTITNCYIAHDAAYWDCHQFITDENINVRKFPNYPAWLAAGKKQMPHHYQWQLALNRNNYRQGY